MHFLAEILALLAPPSCAACSASLPADGAPLCGECFRAMPWLPARCCPRCALPRHGPRGCPAAGAAYATAWAAASYEGVARQLVGALKQRAMLDAAALMAAQIAANAPPGRFDAAAIVPVPPARARRRARGFDPAELLAAELADRVDLPLEWCLRRVGRPVRQVGATRRERRQPHRVLCEALREPPPTVLLVDDVHTTGATLDACARTLRIAGAQRVDAVTYARTLHRSSGRRMC